MTKQIEVPESEILDWTERDWTYVGPSETKPDHCIIRWDHPHAASMPFRGPDELAHIHGGAGMEAVA